MKQIFDFWFPDYDDHFPKMLTKSQKNDGVIRYQWRARDLAIKESTNHRICIDIGANVGLWSCELVDYFDTVLAFEPVEEFRQCFIKNVKKSNYVLYPVALGKLESTIDMNIVRGNTGHSHVDPTSLGKGSIPLKILDSYDFADIDMIKIDVEGLEEDILQGSEKTIRKNKPLLVIEQQKHEYKDAMTDLPSVKILEKWGYKVVGHVKKDWILKWSDH
jgi:FkbM family methyltransferase